MKNTKSRNKILELLESNSFPMSANEIYNKLKNENVTLSTIYRSLSSFLENKLIDKMETDDGVALFSIKKDEHLHYLQCNKCHKQIPIDYCPYDKLKKEIEDDNGFVINADNKILYGVCKDCKDK